MNPIEGKNVLLQFYKDGDYHDYVCAEECSIEVSTEEDETTTINDGIWPTYEGDTLGYTIGLSGLIELEEVSPVAFWLLQNFQMMLIPVQFRMFFEEPNTALIKIISGDALILRTTLTGPVLDFAGSTFDLKGSGQMTISNSFIGCEATIESIEITEGDPDSGVQARISYSGVSGASRLDYSIDGGGRLSLFDPGESGFINLSELSVGPHSVTVWAVCENGEDGESNDLTFEIEEGGEPAPACVAPGTVSFSSITSNTATASWAPPDPPPADAYAWELLLDGSPVDSGTTGSASVNLTGLTGGLSYTFRVKSLCETGVSESGFSSGTLNTTGTCNVPGTPVMSLITGTSSTATWTSPTPAPGSGYSWQLLQGVTVVDSGTTGSLSVNLTGLTPETTYTFRVKSICAVGSESGYNSVVFDTIEQLLEWTYNTDGTGPFTILKDASPVVSETTTDSGSFGIADGDEITVDLSDDTNNLTITITDTTTSTVIYTDSGPGGLSHMFTVVSGHSYQIIAYNSST